jgi:peptidoglycan/LPS O-acetylase OafA/YrhL
MTLPLAGHVLTESLVKNSIILVPYITGILFLPSPYLASGELSEIAFPLNSAAWTLSLEIFINLIFALICRRLTTPRLIVLVALSAIGLAVALWVHGDPNLGWKWSTYFGGWARVTFSFFAGILLYRLFCLKKQAQLPAWIGAVLALILIADFSSTHMGHFYTLISCVIVFPATIWIGARTSAWEPLHRLYAWLGRTSYAVYITHLPLMGIYLYCAKRINIDARAHTTLAIALCAILSLGIASLLNAVYDTPIRAYLTKRLMPASQKRDIPGEHAPTGTGE